MRFGCGGLVEESLLRDRRNVSLRTNSKGDPPLYGLILIKRVKRSPVRVVWKFGGGCCLRCLPRLLIMVQNYKVRPKIALVNLQNEMLF
ncbi:hypothetical protein AVEN_225220-1 [Araneus ventricosus]|uniref:Uncharacterized protein n=1 Tax=Araneus ventricosus TaxID=182803 RepID=A0A4Y2ALD5_ARAVE|nr:hypothetical protein AVEN_225220-1 [Araneus ventricosus]